MTGQAEFEAGRSAPGMRYRDVGAAVRWLCQAFGFEKLSVAAGPDGTVTYAELGYGNTIIMLGAVQGFDIDRYMAQPTDIGGAETQCCYFVVKDIDAHYARARKAGCEVVIPLKAQPNGDKVYTCRDPEGHLWTFGTYDPWSLHAPPRDAAISQVAAKPHAGAMASMPTRLIAGLSLATIISGLGALWFYGQFWSSAREASAAPALVMGPELARAIKKERRRLMFERTARRKAESVSVAAREEAARERTLRVSAQKEAKDLAERLAVAVRADQATVDAAIASRTAESQENLRQAQKLKQELAEERSAKEQAHRIAALAERELSDAVAAKDTAEERAREDARRSMEKAEAEYRARQESARRTLEAMQAKLSEAEAATTEAEAARQAADEARKAAERAAKEAETRVAFVSERAKEGTQEALADIRGRLESEQTARVAAEEAAKAAQDELAKERRSKAAAWRTVHELKRRLAKAQGYSGSTSYGSSGSAKAKKTKKAGTTTQVAPKAEPSSDQWNLYRGPAFSKQ
jgi:uncharacterized glyoxalase superfamily protein PhnB